MRRAHVPAAVLDPVQDGGEALLPEEAAHRFLRVLRLRAGAEVELFDGAGRIARGTLEPGPPARIVGCRVLHEGSALPPLVVVQAVVKTDKLEQVVRRATELGASEIALYAAERSVVQLGDRAERRLDRLERVAEDAARQCERAVVPRLSGPLTLDELAARVASFAGVAAIGVVGAERPLSEALADDERLGSGGLLVIVGPEGGLSAREAERLVSSGAAPVALGAHVLRTETAGLAALAAAQVVLGRL